MQRHVKNFLKATRLLPHEISCKLCGSYDNIDLHHIENRQKNRPDLDEAENIIPLCRIHHTWAHANNTQETKDILRSKNG